MKAPPVLVTALGPLAWGTTYAVTAELLPAGRPLTAATLRALPVGLLLVARARALPPRRWWVRVFVLGALNFSVFFVLLFVAASRLAGGVAATIGATQPLVVMLLATLVLKQALVLRRLGAAAVALVGVALLVLDGSASVDSLGAAAASVAAVSMATGTVLVERWGRPAAPATFAGWQLAAGGLMLLPLTLLVEGVPSEVTTANAIGYLYLAVIGGAFAYSLWFRGIAALGAARMTFLVLLSPVVATLLTLRLGEPFTVLQLVGVVAVITSVVAASSRSRAPAPVPRGAIPETTSAHRRIPVLDAERVDVRDVA